MRRYKLLQLKHFGWILLLCIFSASCEKEDDVTEIFNENRFKITGITYNGKKVIKDVKEFYEIDNTYWITFTHTTFTGVLQSGMNINGMWKADGKSRKLWMDIKQQSRPENTSVLCDKVYEIIKGATKYSGDKNVLKIQKDSSSYIELSSI